MIDERYKSSMPVILYMFKVHNYRTKTALEGQLPAEYTPCTASTDGNCLFSSVSIALFGSEQYQAHIRYAAVFHAVQHFDHYFEMVR